MSDLRLLFEETTGVTITDAYDDSDEDFVGSEVEEEVDEEQDEGEDEEDEDQEGRDEDPEDVLNRPELPRSKKSVDAANILQQVEEEVFTDVVYIVDGKVVPQRKVAEDSSKPGDKIVVPEDSPMFMRKSYPKSKLDVVRHVRLVAAALGDLGVPIDNIVESTSRYDLIMGKREGSLFDFVSNAFAEMLGTAMTELDPDVVRDRVMERIGHMNDVLTSVTAFYGQAAEKGVVLFDAKLQNVVYTEAEGSTVGNELPDLDLEFIDFDHAYLAGSENPREVAELATLLVQSMGSLDVDLPKIIFWETTMKTLRTLYNGMYNAVPRSIQAVLPAEYPEFRVAAGDGSEFLADPESARYATKKDIDSLLAVARPVITMFFGGQQQNEPEAPGDLGENMKKMYSQALGLGKIHFTIAEKIQIAEDAGLDMGSQLGEVTRAVESFLAKTRRKDKVVTQTMAEEVWRFVITEGRLAEIEDTFQSKMEFPLIEQMDTDERMAHAHGLYHPLLTTAFGSPSNEAWGMRVNFMRASMTDDPTETESKFAALVLEQAQQMTKETTRYLAPELFSVLMVALREGVEGLDETATGKAKAPKWVREEPALAVDTIVRTYTQIDMTQSAGKKDLEDRANAVIRFVESREMRERHGDNSVSEAIRESVFGITEQTLGDNGVKYFARKVRNLGQSVINSGFRVSNDMVKSIRKAKKEMQEKTEATENDENPDFLQYSRITNALADLETRLVAAKQTALPVRCVLLEWYGDTLAIGEEGYDALASMDAMPPAHYMKDGWQTWLERWTNQSIQEITEVFAERMIETLKPEDPALQMEWQAGVAEVGGDEKRYVISQYSTVFLKLVQNYITQERQTGDFPFRLNPVLERKAFGIDWVLFSSWIVDGGINFGDNFDFKGGMVWSNHTSDALRSALRALSMRVEPEARVVFYHIVSANGATFGDRFEAAKLAIINRTEEEEFTPTEWEVYQERASKLVLDKWKEELGEDFTPSEAIAFFNMKISEAAEEVESVDRKYKKNTTAHRDAMASATSARDSMIKALEFFKEKSYAMRYGLGTALLRKMGMWTLHDEISWMAYKKDETLTHFSIGQLDTDEAVAWLRYVTRGNPGFEDASVPDGVEVDFDMIRWAKENAGAAMSVDMAPFVSELETVLVEVMKRYDAFGEEFKKSLADAPEESGDYLALTLDMCKKEVVRARPESESASPELSPATRPPMKPSGPPAPRGYTAKEMEAFFIDDDYAERAREIVDDANHRAELILTKNVHLPLRLAGLTKFIRTVEKMHADRRAGYETLLKIAKMREEQKMKKEKMPEKTPEPSEEPAPFAQSEDGMPDKAIDSANLDDYKQRLKAVVMSYIKKERKFPETTSKLVLLGEFVADAMNMKLDINEGDLENMRDRIVNQMVMNPPSNDATRARIEAYVKVLKSLDGPDDVIDTYEVKAAAPVTDRLDDLLAGAVMVESDASVFASGAIDPEKYAKVIARWQSFSRLFEGDMSEMMKRKNVVDYSRAMLRNLMPKDSKRAPALPRKVGDLIGIVLAITAAPELHAEFASLFNRALDALVTVDNKNIRRRVTTKTTGTSTQVRFATPTPSEVPSSGASDSESFASDASETSSVPATPQRARSPSPPPRKPSPPPRDLSPPPSRDFYLADFLAFNRQQNDAGALEMIKDAVEAGKVDFLSEKIDGHGVMYHLLQRTSYGTKILQPLYKALAPRAGMTKTEMWLELWDDATEGYKTDREGKRAVLRGLVEGFMAEAGDPSAFGASAYQKYAPEIKKRVQKPGRYKNLGKYF